MFATPSCFAIWGKIARFALITLRGSARNDFQIRNAGQSGQDLLLDTLSEVGVIRIGTQVLKLKDRDTLWNYDSGFTVPNRHTQDLPRGRAVMLTSTAVLGLRRTHLLECVKNPLRFAQIGSCFSQCSRSSASARAEE